VILQIRHQSAGEEGPNALELYANFDIWCSTGKRW